MPTNNYLINGAYRRTVQYMIDSWNKCKKNIVRPKYAAMFILFVISFYILLIARADLTRNIRGVFILLLPFSLSYLMTPFMICLAPKISAIDQPEARKVHKTPTPLLGGAAVYLAFAIGSVSTLWYSYELKGVVYAATLIFLLGLFDDIFGLSSTFRLLIQLIAVSILIYFGLEVDFVPEVTRFHLIEKAVTVIWVIGISNAVNFLDGIDGLCAGFGAIAALFFGIIAFLTGQVFLMFLAFSLSGSCFGFLPWNFRSSGDAKIFLGDSGSLFIGFTLASFALMGDWAENNVVALSVPLLILLLPIFDTTMTTYFRIREGSVSTVKEWLDYVGKDHFHHRLYAMGIGKRNAVWTMYLVTALLGISAITIRTSGILEAWLAIIQAFIVLAYFIGFMVYVRKNFRENQRRSTDH